ncbi:MAG: hypothetical protein HYX52_04650 [Chloroflexi bacterium]|nr:hypothetical protein [Chloroflexota bacterium]
MIARAAAPLFFAASTAAALVTAWLGAPLAYDGSYYLFKALDLQTPFTPLDRRVNVVLQAPVLLASTLTSDLDVLRRVFAVPYTLLPTLALALAWWVCRRRRPDLFVWPVLTAGLGVLAGQFFYTSEGPVLAAFTWPLLLGVLLGVTRVQGGVLAGVAAALWFTHPLFVVLEGLVGVIALLRAWRATGTAARHEKPGEMQPDGSFAPLRITRRRGAPRGPEERRWLALGGAALLVAAVAKALAPLSGYESESLTPQRLIDSYTVAVRGWPQIAIALSALAGLATLVQRWLPSHGPVATGTRWLPAALALGAGAALVPWARNAYTWAHMLDFRFWVWPIALAGLGVASAEWLAGERQPDAQIRAVADARGPAVVAAGLAIAVVLTLQARSWTSQVDALRQTLAQRAGQCIAISTLPSIDGSPMNHWGTTSLAFILQGRTPTTFVPEAPGCEDLAADRGVRLASFDTRPQTGGWFDLSRLRGAPPG